MNEMPVDIQRALDAVLQGGRLTEMIIDGDDPIGSFDGDDRDILVQGALSDMLRVKGQGSLVVEGDATTVLMPGERYAHMPNVYFLPSSAALSHWLKRCGVARRDWWAPRRRGAGQRSVGVHVGTRP